MYRCGRCTVDTSPSVTERLPSLVASPPFKTEKCEKSCDYVSRQWSWFHADQSFHLLRLHQTSHGSYPVSIRIRMFFHSIAMTLLLLPIRFLDVRRCWKISGRYLSCSWIAARKCERVVLGKGAKVLSSWSAQGNCPPHRGR